MPQTAYLLKQAPAYEGGRGDNRPATIHTGRNNAGVEIPFGRFVAFDAGAGTTELAVRLPSAVGDKLLGVGLYDAAHEVSATGYLANGMIGVIAKGSVWMITEQAVTRADSVFARYALVTGSGTTPAIGRVRKDVDTADAVAVPNARFLTNAAAGGFVLVELNLP